MTEAVRLVDELTTLLYEVIKRWQLRDGSVCEIVQCGACRKKADKPESVVHESDCPVYRLHRAEEANTAVIRANAEEIADLEDKRDELEARVNALTAEMECRNELASGNARLTALLAERDARIAALVAEAAPLRRVFDALNRYQEAVERAKCGEPASDMRHAWAEVKAAADSLRSALAAAGGEGTAT